MQEPILSKAEMAEQIRHNDGYVFGQVALPAELLKTNRYEEVISYLCRRLTGLERLDDLIYRPVGFSNNSIMVHVKGRPPEPVE